MASVDERVIARLNKQFGRSADSLHTSRQLVDNFTSELQCITSKIALGSAIDSAPPGGRRSNFQAAVHSIKTTHDAIEVQIAKIDKFQAQLIEALRIQDGHLQNVDEPLRQIGRLECLLEYLRVVQNISELSGQLQANADKDDMKSVALYLKLCGGVVDRLENVEAPHLKLYAEKTAIYWHNVLVEKFTKQFEACLKSIKWPNMGLADDQFAPTPQVCGKLRIYAEFILLIKHPHDDTEEYVAITPAILCPPISLPTLLLLKPFRHRFLYHFSGTKQTNRLDKPEWFYTQILSWAKDNHLFAGNELQLAANHSGRKDINVRLEFVRGLVQLAVEKLCHDIEEIAQDDHLFAHLLDETLSFEQELRDQFDYPVTFLSALTVLTQPQYLMKWLAAEENFSTSQMDNMLTKGTPWEFIDPINLDDLKIPKCADQFVRLLEAIKERYSVLPQPGHQMQFLNLQIELIDSFRRRLVQLHSSSVDHVSSTKILNAIHYVVAVLREWGESVHYLALHKARIDAPTAPTADSDAEVTSVFEKVISEFEHWDRQIATDLAGKIVVEIKARSMPYRRDEWVTMQAPEVGALLPSGGEMFQVMASALHDLETELSVNIFRRVLRMIAAKLDLFFIDGMIMNTLFSAGGSLQFRHDMQRCLFPLFAQYLARPQVMFKRIQDSCVLLTLPLGNALLLNETLEKQNANEDEVKGILADVGVLHLTGRLSKDILFRRTDMAICVQ